MVGKDTRQVKAAVATATATAAYPIRTRAESPFRLAAYVAALELYYHCKVTEVLDAIPMMCGGMCENAVDAVDAVGAAVFLVDDAADMVVNRDAPVVRPADGPRCYTAMVPFVTETGATEVHALLDWAHRDEKDRPSPSAPNLLPMNVCRFGQPQSVLCRSGEVSVVRLQAVTNHADLQMPRNCEGEIWEHRPPPHRENKTA